MKKATIVFVCVAVVGTVIALGFFISRGRVVKQQANPAAKDIRIGLSLDTLQEDRWKTDESLIEQKAAEMGASVVVEVANSDDTLQVSQIENLIAQKVDVLIIVPHSAAAVAPTIAEAHQKGIKVVAYDRLITNSDLDGYVSFDSEVVGQMEAQSVLGKVSKGNFAYVGGSPTDNNSAQLKTGSMEVLQPYIKKGDIKLVFNQLTNNWSPDIANKNINNLLDSGQKLDAVVCANDGMAYGVVLALATHHLAGKVPVSGQDAELSALQRIKAGTQTATVYKPIKLEADQAVEMAVGFANKQVVQTNKTVNNGQIDVPSYLLTPVLVNSGNMADTVIKDGFHTLQEINGK